MTAVLYGGGDEIDLAEMGVFEDGTVFLSGSGLAEMCGVERNTINRWANEFDANSGRKRDEALYGMLQARQYTGDSLFVKAKLRGQTVNAFPEPVCTAIIQYYAFDSDKPTAQARRSLQLFMQAGLRFYVYGVLGYDPTKVVPPEFQAYHARLLLNRIPSGYFSVLQETSRLVLEAIRHELIVDSRTIPDISVGQCWATYWKANGLRDQCGPRTKYPHKYPDDHPQAKANDYIEAWIYPNAARGLFHDWLDREYLPRQYPKYLRGKVKDKVLPPQKADLLIDALVPAQLEADHE